MILAALKFIDPIVAAILHVVGSLMVVFNSARLVRQGEELEPHLARRGRTARRSATPVPRPLTPSPRQRMSAVAEICAVRSRASGQAESGPADRLGSRA